MIDDKKIEETAKQHSEESYISDYFQACYKDAYKKFENRRILNK